MFKDLDNFKKVKTIFNILKEAGAESRFVGGCVRDSIANKEIRDVDIATTLVPDQVEKIFANKGFKTLDIGKSFGTITIIIDEYPYEITTLRKDIETDGRRATSIEYTDNWDEDALRRDFTINAMSYCPYQQKLYDYFGGENDLKQGIVKFVGEPEERVQEDFLRIMRFFRFYTYYGKHHSIDKDSLDACIQYAERIEILSGERKYHEFYKILMHEDKLATLELMLNSNVLEHLFKSKIQEKTIFMLSSISQINHHYSYQTSILLDVFTIAELNNISIETLYYLFRLSNKEKNYLKNIYNTTRRNLSDITNNVYNFVYVHKEIALDTIVYLLSRENKDPKKFTNVFDKIKKIINSDIPDFPIKGRDLLNKFNLEPGPYIKNLISSAENYWCNSEFKATKDELMNFISQSIKKNNE